MPVVAIRVAILLALVICSRASVADPSTPSANDKGFRFVDVDAQSLGLWEGDRPVFVYNHGTKSRSDVPKDRWRSTYVHPLFGLDGEVLTDDFPRDHYHHRGLFWAWPHVKVGGNRYDLWMLRGVEQRFVSWLKRSADEQQAILAVENGWYVGDERIVKEEVRFTVAKASADQRAIDVRLTLTALGKSVTLDGAEGKGYGGLSLRFAPRKATAITTERGRQKEDLNLARIDWADLTAAFRGTDAPSGVSIVVGRGHGDQLPRWITREYGFLGVGWPEGAGATLEPDRPIAMEYRIIVHRGPPDASRLNDVRDTMRDQDRAR